MELYDEESGRASERDPEIPPSAEVVGGFDRLPPRGSISDGVDVGVEPGKVLEVLEKISIAMERVDLDIRTSISIDRDIVGVDQLAALIEYWRLGPLLAAHVVNTAMRIMLARYPEELVCRPLPEQFDLRKKFPVSHTDQEHEIAKAIFDQRAVSDIDLCQEDVAAALEPLGRDGQIQVLVALVFMYGGKVGALKYRTGIE